MSDNTTSFANFASDTIHIEVSQGRKAIFIELKIIM